MPARPRLAGLTWIWKLPVPCTTRSGSTVAQVLMLMWVANSGCLLRLRVCIYNGLWPWPCLSLLLRGRSGRVSSSALCAAALFMYSLNSSGYSGWC